MENRSGMKWPEQLMLIRHDVSGYNMLRAKKAKSELYQKFLIAFAKNQESEETKALALQVQEKFSLNVGDANTPLHDREAKRACEVGVKLRELYGAKPPHIIFVSPYERTLMTLQGLRRGWPELHHVKVVEEERIREQEHGASLLYNDWRVFHALNPGQGRLFGQESDYWYRYPQGESVPDVRMRIRSWTDTLIRDFNEQRVFAVTHHLSILSFRSNIERWGAKKFMQVDKEDKPINCGVTEYRGNPNVGKNGHLELFSYNEKYYEMAA